jgi:hypothetical protein
MKFVHKRESAPFPVNLGVQRVFKIRGYGKTQIQSLGKSAPASLQTLALSITSRAISVFTLPSRPLLKRLEQPPPFM